MPPATLSGHTPGHVDCPKCEAGKLRLVAPAEFGALHFDAAARIWLAEHCLEIAGSTYRNYQHHLRTLNQFFGEMVLQNIKVWNVEQYQLWRQQPWHDEVSGRTFRAGYSPINHECSTLAQILGRAGLWTEIARFYRPLKQPKQRAGRALEAEEQERLFYFASSHPRWKVAYLASLVTANTTAGPNEIRHIHLGDIDLTRRGGDGQPLPTLTIRDGLKNEHRNRTVFLNPTAVMALDALIKRAHELGCHDEEHFLLPHRAHRRGEVADPNRPMGSWKRAWQGMRLAAGIPGLRMYDLRHHAITKLLESPEVSDQTVQEIAGHVSKRIKDRYSHIRMARKREALLAAETKAPPMQLGFSFGAVIEMPARAKPEAVHSVQKRDTKSGDSHG